MSTDEPNDRLTRAIENLYTTFAIYKLKPHVDGCPHCTTDSDHARIHSRPLHELALDDLQRFAFKAITTWGDEDDFRHFLPRIFELLVRDLNFGVDAEIAIGKLRSANWRRWPIEEQLAIEAYLYAVWDVILNGENFWIDADTWISCLSNLDDLSAALDRWTQNESVGSVNKLVDFVNDNYPTLMKKRSLNSAFADEATSLQTMNWLLSKELESKLERVVLGTNDEKLASNVSNVIELLRILRERDAARKDT